MITMVKDYWKYCVVPSFHWMRLHWRGYLGILAVLGVVFMWDSLVYFIKNKIRKSKKEEP